jgi:transposase
LLGISKRGDGYLRKLLVHGARAVLRVAAGKEDAQAEWMRRLAGRRNANIATVALANKNARIAWALLAHGRVYEADHQRAAANP